jgi:ABC-2 type transport system ATP-binding protein
LIVGLDHPIRGTVTVNGRRCERHRAPPREVGALLDAKAVNTGRSAHNHLLAMGATHGIGKSRVREVIQ